MTALNIHERLLNNQENAAGVVVSANDGSSTMRDVALAAGVSISAVSYVLNDSRPVRADKRVRIEQAMAALDYIPNRTAQALKGSRSRLIGVLLPDLTNPIYGQIASSIK
jgi:LacI family transcriptional regulator